MILVHFLRFIEKILKSGQNGAFCMFHVEQICGINTKIDCFTWNNRNSVRFNALYGNNDR